MEILYSRFSLVPLALLGVCVCKFTYGRSYAYMCVCVRWYVNERVYMYLNARVHVRVCVSSGTYVCFGLFACVYIMI